MADTSKVKHKYIRNKTCLAIYIELLNTDASYFTILCITIFDCVKQWKSGLNI